MRFASLGSGSKGNATLVEWRDTRILVDCGFSGRECQRRLGELQLEAASITAILVTHEHSDHVRGVMTLSRRFGLPVYLTAGTAAGAGVSPGGSVHVIKAESGFQVGELQIMPVAVPHDAREPVQYIVRSRHHALGVLTDLGSLTPGVLDHYKSLDALLLEANHDRGMLASGPYPPALKRRVGGARGHLSNCQSAELLAAVQRDRLQHLVLGHISEKNNSLKLVRETCGGVTDGVDNVVYANQNRGCDWLQLN